ncbi:terminase large subunit domain-containing protein [Deinococcus cellulosilyticus]|uniref:Uncharacterized protein n=1 Tax=Deinococcus cellulosilyticus (strain DSM 18568 / NBRC 106333 / KACC 11606 / 5516J-15) TaxID=1223518 RepID=A0A511MX23_DEIC1|nr:terminase family protein [Deinococcus cellulosilyticus]GEM44818.1 hypothetical protein DC3_04530 [Deinococcus cellulosilyticus NBRC 106333 = KACC 11606]
MSRKPQKTSFFLPYQQDWLKDTSRLKIAEKSRRVGWTYVQAYEDVRDAAKDGGMDVYFSSADISAAREYIRYVEMWSRVLHIAAESLGEIVFDSEDDIKALCVEYSNGHRIYALSSNPKGFRSKGGKVVLDEFAFHEQPDEMWKAASPAILWGYPIRVFSSHNGKDSRFYRMVEEAREGKGGWSLHTCTIQRAIDDGLVEKVKKLDRPATEEEKAQFLQECQDIAGDPETFEQEFMCNPLDGKTSWITYSMIQLCEDKTLPLPIVIKGEDIHHIPLDEYTPYLNIPPGTYFLGQDVGRKKDLTVYWLFEKIGNTYFTRYIIELHTVKYRYQFKWLSFLLPHVFRACLDAGGIGSQLAEDAQEDFGTFKVEAVTFNNTIKEDMAITTLRSFQDLSIRLPSSEVVRRDITKIKKTTTTSGNARFEGERDKDGHADRFWAMALGLRAAKGSQIYYQSSRRKSSRR